MTRHAAVLSAGLFPGLTSATCLQQLAMRLAVLHNLYFYNALMDRIRLALEEGTFEAFYREYREKLGARM